MSQPRNKARKSFRSSNVPLPDDDSSDEPTSTSANSSESSLTRKSARTSKNASAVSNAQGSIQASGISIVPLSKPITSRILESTESDDDSESQKRNERNSGRRKRIVSQSSSSDEEYVAPTPTNSRRNESAKLNQKGSQPASNGVDRKFQNMSVASSSRSHVDVERDASSQDDIVHNLAYKAVYYILVAEKKKTGFSKNDIVKHVFESQYTKLYPHVLEKANRVLRNIYGLKIVNLNCRNKAYMLVNMLAKDSGIQDYFKMYTLDAQKMAFVHFLLTIIFMNENSLEEEQLRHYLRPVGIDFDSTTPHYVFGDIKRFITDELVKQMYLERKCTSRDPPKYELLWGERAHHEVQKKDMLEFASKLLNTQPQDWKYQYNDATANDPDEDGE